MFLEFNNDELEQWNNLSEKQKIKLIKDGLVTIVADVDIVIEENGVVSQEHKYYQVFESCRLINNIVISKITEQQTFFNNDGYELIIKNGEEKIIDMSLGTVFKIIYKIRVHNIKYGTIKEI